MSSAYEGMPIALIEAMACGLPVAATDVGEVRRLVVSGRNGEIAGAGDAEGLAAAISRGITHFRAYGGAPCIEAASQFTPQRVLGPVYENYGKLAAEGKRSEHDFP